MFPAGTPDPEYPNDVNETGTRLDGKNLVQEWLSKHQVMGWQINSDAGETREGLWALPVVYVPLGFPVCLESPRAHSEVPGSISDVSHG